MITCPGCRREAGEDSHFCGGCGHNLKWVIGSGSDCDVQIADPKVSSRHCALRISGSGYLLTDLNSRNGTWVNGERVVEPVTVTTADQVFVSRSVLLPW